MAGQRALQKKPGNADQPRKEGGKSIWTQGRPRAFIRRVGWTLAAILLLVAALFLALDAWPAFGAQGANLLREVIGDAAVAKMEMVYNSVSDSLLHWTYDLGLAAPAPDWQVLPTTTASPTQVLTVTGAPRSPSGTQSAEEYQATRAWAATFIPPPVYTPTPFFWNQPNVPPLGTVQGEGVWSPYIQDASGQTVAYRTFLQPDPNRPYTLVAVIAIDLNHTRLHFVLGTQDPSAPESPPHSGMIPLTDKTLNVLLAAFNGGFKARHGQFGSMADGITALPPRNGLGTLVIHEDGKLELGEWGKDIFMTPSIVSLRQNGPLVIAQGQISPRIYSNSPKDWGYTVTDVSPTVRSGIGLSRDAKTLYYFCGPSLSMEMLAKSMQTAGVWNGIQLDINNYWVLFVKIQTVGSKLIPEPLLPRLMVAALDRYLYNSSRDFFYITTIKK